MDYVVKGTRVICNPRGYAPADLNKAFDPKLVVELPVGTAQVRDPSNAVE